MRLTLAFAVAPRRAAQVVFEAPDGASVQQALDALRAQQPQLAAQLAPLIATGGVGLHGQRAAPAQVLQDGERLDVAAPLITTPQQARQRRFEVQGARTAGLFARRRPGAKPGY